MREVTARVRALVGIRADGESMPAIRALALMNVMLKADLPFHAALASSRGVAVGAHREIIDRAFRGTLLGTYPSLKHAVEREVSELPTELAWVGRTLREYMICGSEGDVARRGEMLDRAFSSALDSCRQSMKEAASGLRVPVSTIFALGIVLPIVLATMLPLWGVAYSEGFSRGVDDFATDQWTAGSPTAILAAPILLFPAVCMIATARVLSKGDFALCRGERRQTMLMLAFFGAMGAVDYVVIFVIRIDAGVPIFTLAAVTASMLACRLLWGGVDDAPANGICDRPSELAAISARLASGEHFVRAVAMSSACGSEKGRIFWQAMGVAAAGDRRSGADGETLRMIAQTAKSDSCLAAQMLRQFARHLNDLALVRTELSFDLRPIAQSALVATVFLSPFVLGISAGFESVGAASSPVGELFAAFIPEMVISGLWLVRRMGVGDGAMGAIAGRPALALGVSALSFLLSLSFSKAVFA